MPEFHVTPSITAPVETVFNTISNPVAFSKRIDTIIKIEFLTDQRSGVGTRFKETRIVNGKETTATLEITELVVNQSIRFVSDEGGTIWDTLFTTTPSDEGTVLTMEMVAQPYTLVAKVVTRLIYRMVAKAVESDMDATQAYCESQ